MAYQVGKFNQTVLFGIPEAPPLLLNVSRPNGIYIVGYSYYIDWVHSIVPLPQRLIDMDLFIQMPVEQFITGVLAVLLITIFSEIVQTILLRTTNNAITRNGLRTATRVDEFSHFRNVWNRATSSQSSKCRKTIFSAIFKQQSTLLSMFVLFIASVIFAADAIVIFLTRDRVFSSAGHEFNLRGVSPIATNQIISKRIRYLIGGNGCVVPWPWPSTIIKRQQKNFKIEGCVEYDTGPRILPSGENPSTVTLRSWYHEGGSDHNISFAEKWHSVKTRAMVYLEKDSSMKRILFHRSMDWHKETAFLQNVSIHLAMQWSCNRKKAKYNCSEIVKELEFHGEQLEERNITLWERKGKPVNIGVVGLRSRYTIDLFQQEKVLYRGLQVLTTSTAVLKAKGPGGYEDDITGERMSSIEGLMSETGRLAGTYLLLALVLSFGAILIFLRVLFDPISLAELAMLYSHRAKKYQRRAISGRKRRTKRNHSDVSSETSREADEQSPGIHSIDSLYEREHENEEYSK